MQERVSTRKQPMRRKQIFVTAEQERRLKSLSAATSRPEGELIREAIGEWLTRQEAHEADWKAGVLSVAGLWADYPEVEEVVARGRRSWARRRQALKR
jgi:predicted transcriptional regulator